MSLLRHYNTFSELRDSMAKVTVNNISEKTIGEDAAYRMRMQNN